MSSWMILVLVMKPMMNLWVEKIQTWILVCMNHSWCSGCPGSWERNMTYSQLSKKLIKIWLLCRHWLLILYRLVLPTCAAWTVLSPLASVAPEQGGYPGHVPLHLSQWQSPQALLSQRVRFQYRDHDQWTPVMLWTLVTWDTIFILNTESEIWESWEKISLHLRYNY